MYVLQEVVKVAIVVRVAVAVIPIQLKFCQLQQAQANNKKLKIKRVRKSDGIHSEVQNVCISSNSTSFFLSLKSRRTSKDKKSCVTNTKKNLAQSQEAKKKNIQAKHF